MKLFICADMEGATGIVHRDQLMPEGGAAYAAGCKLLTGDIVHDDPGGYVHVRALFGDSPVERWRPWGVPHRVVRPESRNLADLPLEPVLAAWDELAR